MYLKLKENSKCSTCIGCSKLENIEFIGVKECDNYISSESPIYYGSLYGNNN